MRKYYKLLLVGVTLVSLVAFAFYKAQYDKLYGVLQVLEFFGTPSNASAAAACSTSSVLTWLMSPAPTWTRLTPAAFSFSAFCRADPFSGKGDCPVVEITAIANANENLGNFNCKLWYDGSVHAIDGSLNVESSSMSSSGASLVRVGCASKFASRVPFGVSLVAPSSSSKDSKEEIFVRVEPEPETGPPANSVAVCILPARDITDHTYRVAENILLASMLGVKTFVLYDGGGAATSRLARLVASASSADSQLHVRVVPWNPPLAMSAADANNAVATDCLLRTRSAADTVVALNLTQVLVPVRHDNVASAVASVGGGSFDAPLLRFCSELPADPRSDGNDRAMLAMEQTDYDASLSASVTVIRRRKVAPLAPDGIPDLLAVHDYGPCGKFDFDQTNVKRKDRMLTFAPAAFKLFGSFLPKKG